MRGKYEKINYNNNSNSGSGQLLHLHSSPRERNDTFRQNIKFGQNGKLSASMFKYHNCGGVVNGGIGI